VQRVYGRPELPEPFVCEPNPAFSAMPTLPTMARAALDRLDGKSFMLMIESASIDKQSHLRRPCGQIGELGQLDDTLKVVLDYARAHPETLVLVTADHSQAAQLLPETSVLAALNAASPGYFARLRTPEGGLMGVGYATNDSTVQEDHTGADVPLFASGPGSDAIPSSLRQPEIFGLLLRHLGLTAPR
jgi:alkaline phosphatase